MLDRQNFIDVRWIILISLIFFFFDGPISAQDLSDKEYELISAAEEGRQDKILDLLNDSINPNVRDWYGMTPLHYAVQNGHIKAVKALLLNGALADISDYDERSPLHLAVHFNHLEIAEYLVQNGASTNKQDQFGLSPLFYSSAYGDYFMTDMFLFYSEGKQLRDAEGKTPFLSAVWGGHIHTASLLLKYFSDVNEKDNKGNNAIHLAVLNRDIEMIDSLYSWGCDITAENEDNYSCLDQAIQENSYLVVEKLIELGADVNHNITKGLNSLDMAMLITKNQEISELMERSGAVRNKRPGFNQPAISLNSNTMLQDVFSGFSLEIWEPKYRLGFKIGALQRLGRLKVITPAEGNVNYQFRETMTGFLAGIEKQWMLIRLERQEMIGMKTGLDVGYFLGQNKGSEEPAGKIWVPVTSMGIYYQKGAWQVALTGLHMDLKTFQLPAVRFGFSVTRRFNELK